MGSHLTGADALGDQNGSAAKEAGKGNYTVAHGTVRHDEAESQNELESGLFETEKEKAASASDKGNTVETKATSQQKPHSPMSALRYVMTRSKEGSMDEEKQSGRTFVEAG